MTAEIRSGQPGDTLVLRSEGLVKTYGKRTVVNNVSFDVKQGEGCLLYTSPSPRDS